MMKKLRKFQGLEISLKKVNAAANDLCSFLNKIFPEMKLKFCFMRANLFATNLIQW